MKAQKSEQPHGTIFECDGKKAVRHKVNQAETKTRCGKEMYNAKPDREGNLIKDTFHVEHELKKETRCKICYPDMRR